MVIRENVISSSKLFFHEIVHGYILRQESAGQNRYFGLVILLFNLIGEFNFVAATSGNSHIDVNKYYLFPPLRLRSLSSLCCDCSAANPDLHTVVCITKPSRWFRVLDLTRFRQLPGLHLVASCIVCSLLLSQDSSQHDENRVILAILSGECRWGLFVVVQG